MLNVDAIDGSVLQALKGKLNKLPTSVVGAGGSVPIVTFAGAASGAAAVGTLGIDTTNGKLYICTVAAGTWVVVGTQT